MLKKLLTIALLALLASTALYGTIWLHHLFVTGLNPFLGIVFLLLSLAITIPPLIWSIRRISRIPGIHGLNLPWLFFFGALVFAWSDLFESIVLANSTLDIQFHDTYFVLAHTYGSLVPAALLLAFAAIYAGYPLLLRRQLNPVMGHIHFWITSVVCYLLIASRHYEPLVGMQRRYINYSPEIYSQFLTNRNRSLELSGILFLLGQVVFLINLIYSALPFSYKASR
jgi:cytochrome c oxidase subunit 1